MKPSTAVFAVLTILVSAVSLGVAFSHPSRFHVEPQFAAGQWKIEVQIPPCAFKDGKPNIEVNFKPDLEHPSVATIECNEMPVATR